MTNAADLFALQEIDLAIDSAVARLAEIEANTGETQELMDARASVQEKQAVAAAMRSRQKDLEWRVDEMRGKTVAIEEKLYGGSLRNPKELADLDADLKSLKNQLRIREDDLLMLLVEIDDAEADLATVQASYAEIESLWQDRQQRLRDEKDKIEPEVERLQASRRQESATIDRASLGLYKLLRERRGGRAVARVERGMCQGCRITLPMSVLQKARAGIALVQCVSCERMLLVS